MRFLITAVTLALMGMMANVRFAAAQEEEIRAAMLESLAAWKDGDIETFGRFFGPESRGFNLDGGLLIRGFNPVVLRAAISAGVVIDVTPRDMDIMVLGDVAASVAYLDGTITLPGGVVQEGTWRYSETRVREGDVWRIVQYHISQLTVAAPGQQP